LTPHKIRRHTDGLLRQRIHRNVVTRRLLNLMRIDDVAVSGFTVGITAHAIGTAYALQVSDIAGAFAALGMGLNGVATTLLLPLMVQLAATR
jgi:putative effector of murein hydrolase